jgi:hypothetical protein
MASDGRRTMCFTQSIKSFYSVTICHTNMCERNYKKKVAMLGIWMWSKGANQGLINFERIRLWRGYGHEQDVMVIEAQATNYVNPNLFIGMRLNELGVQYFLGMSIF